MANRSNILALIPAAGDGRRFEQGASPKQYAPLCGRTVLECTIERLREGLRPQVIGVVLSPNDTHFARLRRTEAGIVPLYCGGATRAESVTNGLRALAQKIEVDESDWIAVHDAARPCVPLTCLRTLRALVESAPPESKAGALLALPLRDTLKEARENHDGTIRVVVTYDRNRFWTAQTPQIFRYTVLKEALALRDAKASTDEAQAVERWCADNFLPLPQLMRGSAHNIKITYREDLAVAEAILTYQKGASS
ncbi:MAG: 2-C-methyl-D-erythritol 4-phosphate cytidylyltransferase [Burkholderiales bacterium]|nr:2-C-methyl-D-erythritol 4-phosphate cytidylyltransferase [Burkholderiales bacterium]